MPEAPQVVAPDELAYDAQEWYVTYLPSFGISSAVHFALLVTLFAFSPSHDFKAPPAEKVKLNDLVMQKTPEVPMPPPPEKPDETPAVRDIEDSNKIEMEISTERNPVHEKDIEVSDHYETDDDEDGHGASGDPNQRGEINTAFQIDNFIKGGKGMQTVRGKGRGTGNQERFGQRGPGGRKNLTKAKGGGPRTENAVKHALEWLKRHQASDGHWSNAGFDGLCRDGKCSGPGVPDYDVGVSSLALLAFLAHGETSQSGTYQDTVRRALQWLKSQQAPDGCIGSKSYDKHLYNHSIGAMALAEAVAMGEYGYKEPAQKAVNYLVACQNAGKGWRYKNYNIAGTPVEKGGPNDTSVTGWCIMALKSAKVAELDVPDSAFQGASAWLDSVYDYDSATYKGRFGYYRQDNGSLGLVHNAPYTTTSIGVLVRLLMSQSKGVSEGTTTLLEKRPEWKSGSINLYYWYYATLALFQVGGDPWRQWNEPMKKALCEHQETKGCMDGSWEPSEDTWGEEGGRVYTTAVGALCLEVYYRYVQGMKIHESGK